jgi:hypothetical protein
VAVANDGRFFRASFDGEGEMQEKSRECFYDEGEQADLVRLEE